MIDGKPSETAQIVCLMRALEYKWNGEKSLLSDKYAEFFLSGRFKFWHSFLSGVSGRILFPAFQWLYDAAVLRSALMDEYVRKHGNECPVVILGAGFDSRAVRMKEQMRKGVYEIDFPATQEYKRSVLRQNEIDDSHVSYYNADFMENTLMEILSGLNLQGRKVILIWEGVSMYLTEELVYETVRNIGQYFGKDSVLIADFWLQSFALPEFINRSVQHLFQILWDEPILFGTSPEELKKNLEEKEGFECGIMSYDSLSEMFSVPKTLYSPFFTAIVKY